MNFLVDQEQAAAAFVAERCADENGMARLRKLACALAEENQRQNLVSRESLSRIWHRHFADSAQLLDHVPRGTAPWLDLGSGAGFPGLVIACLRPGDPIHLVESRKRRIEWLLHMRESLQLDHCMIHGCTVQSLDGFRAGAITARAFAPLPKLLDLSARFSTADTIWVLPKGRLAAQEYARLPCPLRSMFHVEPSATGEEAGILVGRGRVGAQK